MFTILGADGNEYGPASLAQVRAWMNAGRANLDTRAKLPGETEWRRLGDIPEFNGETSASLPPTLDGSAPAASTPVASEHREPELADRLTRLTAVSLDTLIGIVVAIPGGLILGEAFLEAVVAMVRGQYPDFSEIEPGRLLIGFAVLGLATFALQLVQIYLVSTRGQTLGKRFLGIRIVRASDGSNPGFARAWLLRALVPGIIGVLPTIGSVFTIVNYGFIFRADRRCLHDLLADTRVVKVNPKKL
jgi:uncharacterized RDD family membrane protein YckC